MGVVNTYRGETIPATSKTNLEQFKMPWSDKEQVYGVNQRVNVICFKDYFCENSCGFEAHGRNRWV